MLKHWYRVALCISGMIVTLPPSHGQPAGGIREFDTLARTIEARAERGAPPKAHAIVEFSETLSPRQFEQLRTAGADVRATPSSKEWMATMTAEGLQSLVRHPALSRIRAFRPADKASARIDRANPLQRQIRPDGRIAYAVLVFDDATADEVEALRSNLTPAPLEGFDRAMFDRKRSFVIAMDPTKLDALLAAEIVAYVEPPPAPQKPDNEESARLARVGDVSDPNAPSHRLSGAGARVAVVECCAPAQIRDTHADLAGRVDIVDAGTETTHATHVAGTIASRGSRFRATRGIAPNTGIYGLDATNDVSDAVWSASPPYPAIASNHSYGAALGWNWTPPAGAAAGFWTDTGNIAEFGTYTSVSADWDRLIAGDLNQPPLNLVVVKSAGNDRDDVDAAVAGATRDCTATYPPSDGDCLGDFAVAKNIITVGAVELTSAAGAPETVAIADFSSFGPTDDGRIKPDVVAHGVDVISTGFTTTATGTNVDAQLTLSGTSMAAPVVTGIVSLMTEALARRGRTHVWPATYKALLVEHARDVTVAPATRGPDFATGFGIADAAATIRAILEPAEPHYRESWIRDTGREGRLAYFIRIDTNMPELAVTLAWSDPAATPPTASPSTTALLVNDLDLRLIEPGTGQEWAPLRPTVNAGALQAATRGDDDRNNVEKVIVPNPRQGLWVAQVTAKPGSLSGGAQEFALAGPFASLERETACTTKPAVCALPAILKTLRQKPD